MSVDDVQFGFMPERGTIVAVFILRWMQEEYHATGKKLYICFVDLEKAFDIVQRNVLELAMRNTRKTWYFFIAHSNAFLGPLLNAFCISTKHNFFPLSQYSSCNLLIMNTASLVF